MAQNFFSGMFQPVVLDANGFVVPAEGYKAKFYEAGTSTPKTIYTDPSNLIPYPSPSNIAFLDETGKSLIYLGVGGYKLVLTDPNDVPVPGYTIDNIVGEGAFGTGFVNSFADLLDVNTTVFPYVYIGGYYSAGDGGQGMFYNATSATSADGGYVQDSDFDPTKKWFRVPDENGMVRSASFGAIGANVAAPRTSEMQAADAYAASIGAELLINVWVMVGNMTFTAPSVRCAAGAYLEAPDAGSANYAFTGIFSAGADYVFRENAGISAVAFNNASQESRPEWFGASLTASAGDNATEFARWKSAGAGLFIVPPGAWPHTGSFTPSVSSPTMFYGTVGGNDVGIYYPTGGLLTLDDMSIRDRVTFSNGHYFETFFGAGIQTDGDFRAGGNIQADADIVAVGSVTANAGSVSAGTTVSAGTSVDAGTYVEAGSYVQAATYVQARMGTSGENFKASGSGNIVVGAGDASLAANSLTANNDYIRIICAGTTTDTSPTVTVQVGGQTVYSQILALGSTPGASPYSYRVIVEVFRTGATSSFCTGQATVNGSTGGTGARLCLPDTRTPTITWANANAIAHTASATNVKQLTMFEIYPAT